MTDWSASDINILEITKGNRSNHGDYCLLSFLNQVTKHCKTIVAIGQFLTRSRPDSRRQPYVRPFAAAEQKTVDNMKLRANANRIMIVERTQGGRRRTGNLGVRPKVYSRAQRELAMKLLAEGHSYRQVEESTGISKSTLIREHRNQT